MGVEGIAWEPISARQFMLYVGQEVAKGGGPVAAFVELRGIMRMQPELLDAFYEATTYIVHHMRNNMRVDWRRRWVTDRWPAGGRTTGYATSTP